MSTVPGRKLSEQQQEALAALLARYGGVLAESDRAALIEQVEAFAVDTADAAYSSGWNDGKGEVWIPITGHYPAPGERVLVFVPRWGVLTIGWLSKNDPTRWELITMPGKSTDQVSHWQPLPAGPLQPPPPSK